MASIKTKMKSTIKTIDKTRVVKQKIKDNLIEVKEKADNINDKQYDSAEEYATQNIKNKADIVANKSINDFDEQGRKSFVDTKNTIQNEIEKYKARQEEKQQIKNNIAKANEIKGLQDTEKLQTNKNQIENVADIKSKDKVVKVNSNKRTLSKNMKQANNLSKKAVLKNNSVLNMEGVIAEVYLFMTHGDYTMEDMAIFMLERGVPKNRVAAYTGLSRRKTDEYGERIKHE